MASFRESVQVRLDEVGQYQSVTYSARSCAELTSGAAHGLSSLTPAYTYRSRQRTIAFHLGSTIRANLTFPSLE